MPEVLANLARTAGDDADPFDAHRTRGQWRSDVGRACAALRQHPAGPVALYHEQAYEFAVWLFAAWHDGRCVRLPSDAGRMARAACDGALTLGQIAGATCPAWPRDVAPLALAPLDPGMHALEVYTSGSTGEPQAIAKRLGQLEREVEALEQGLGALLPEGTTVAATVSHQHMFGLPFALLWPLATGRVLHRGVVGRPAEISGLPDTSALVSSPAFLKRLGDSRATLRAVFCSGSSLPEPTAVQVAERLRAPVIEIYGSSETGAVAWRRAPAAEWQPLPGVEVRTSGQGLLQIRSPLLPDDAWFTSADRARTGAGFELLGRADRIVKLEDKRVSLDALERALVATGLLAEARALVFDGQRSVIGVAAALSDAGRAWYLERDRAALIDELRRVLAAQFDPVALPRRWRFVDQLPADALGKIKAAAIADLFRERPHAPLLLGRRDTADGVEFDLEIPPDLHMFEGHFPEAPIVPGVALLHWVMRYAETAFAPLPAFRGLRALKFHRVVRPRTRLRLRLHRRPGRDTLEFEYESAQGRHASGRILLGGEST